MSYGHVENLRVSALGDEDIGGFDVAMHDSRCVRRVQPSAISIPRASTVSM
jgi:hypothetical protein